MIRRWGALLLLSVVGLAAAGCGKQVNIVFVNQTPYTMPLELQPPGGQRDFVGLLEPRGGAVKTKVPVPEEQAPNRVLWWAGARYKGEFAVTEATDKHLRIDLLPAGPSQPYAWKGKIDTKRP